MSQTTTRNVWGPPTAVQPVRRLDAADVEMRGTNIDTAVSELQLSYTAVWRYDDNAWCMTSGIGTGGSGGSMNRGPELLGPRVVGPQKIFF